MLKQLKKLNKLKKDKQTEVIHLLVGYAESLENLQKCNRLYIEGKKRLAAYLVKQDEVYQQKQAIEDFLSRIKYDK